MASGAIPASLVLSGAYLAWFGVHYWRSAVAWPSDPVKAVLTGKPLPDNTPDTSALLTTSIAGPGERAGAEAAAAIAAGGGAAGSGAVLDKAGLVALWTRNGGNPAAANTAAAIALAESSGNPGATSANPDGGTNVGLWQLDTRGVGSGYSAAALADPDTNARVTIMGSMNGTHWGPWQTYVEGTYRKYL